MILRNIQSRKRNGQSTLEYALLIITVAAAFIAMYRYLSGATGAKLHDIENELNPGVEIQP
ncbi:MAG: hypothetical protein C4540_02285 [Candidatus Omnitrophota bacterium]|nr:MAG: hypothetical protein C4540_02285 [Candidatus Omnitrophota bacterium]